MAANLYLGFSVKPQDCLSSMSSSLGVNLGCAEGTLPPVVSHMVGVNVRGFGLSPLVTLTSPRQTGVG